MGVKRHWEVRAENDYTEPRTPEKRFLTPFRPTVSPHRFALISEEQKRFLTVSSLRFLQELERRAGFAVFFCAAEAKL
jgi:ribosomal protein S4